MSRLGAADPFAYTELTRAFQLTLSPPATVYCDPAATDTFVCPTLPFCDDAAPPPCIASWIWVVNNGSSAEFDIGTYENVWFPCAVADRIDEFVVPGPAGVINCASAVLRVIDKAVWLLTGTPLQCPQGTFPSGPDSYIPGVGPYNDVLGELYGLFYNQVPGLFFSGQFTAAMYAFVAQVVNNERWSIAGVPFDLLDTQSGRWMDYWIMSWVEEQLAAEATTAVPSAFPVTNGAPSSQWDFQGLVGSPFVVPADELVAVNRYGNAVGMNIQNSTRLFTVIAPFAIDGLQLVSAQGICATALGLFPPNTTINLPCVSTPPTLATTLNATYAANPGACPAAAANWSSVPTFILYYTANGTLNASMIFYTGRETSYDSLWTALVQQILEFQILPPNTPLLQAYEATAGAVSRPIDLASPSDQKYLENMWSAVLAPFQCSTTLQCQEFNRHGTPNCVYSSLGYRAWRNGDLPGDGITGDEGGCACFQNFTLGLWDAHSFCQQCTEGNGPVSDAEWELAVNYQEALFLEFPALDFYPVYDPADFPDPPLCNLPAYSTSKPTQVCAGRGTVELATELLDVTIQLFPDNAGNVLTPTCTSLLLSTGMPLYNSNDSIVAQSFAGNGTRINIITSTLGEQIYWRVNQTYVPVPCSNTSCALSPTLSFTCQNPLARYLESSGLLFTSLWVGYLSS